ncbi:acyltransferase family protein [Proteus mirabilis]|uniref:acyltransferase family protein n=1 Tax=Proteus mirabilis TaxID=584 RepID=UPI0034D78316
MLTEQQSLTIRYVQAIGIIFVVMGHYPIRPVDIMQPYLFHMPLFFFLGGILYHEKSFLTLCKSILRKHILYIIYTYIIIGSIATFILNDISPLAINKIFKNGFFDTILFTLKSNFHNNSFFLVAWFLFAYSIVSICSNILISIVKNKFTLFFIALTLGYFAVEYLSIDYKNNKLQGVNLLIQVMYGTMFYIIGYIFKKDIFKLNQVYIPIIILVILFTEKINFNMKVMVMSWSQYPDGFIMHSMNAILCIIFIFSVCSLISSKEYKIIKLIGRHSKSIMSYHLLSFILLDFLFSLIWKYDLSNIRGLSHYSTKEFWFLYVIVGVFIPISIELFYNRIIIKIKPLK